MAKAKTVSTCQNTNGSMMEPAALPFIKQSLGALTLQGISRAGISTCFIIPELKVALDVAQGFSYAVNMQHFLITHAHMDHAAGIPYLISQKALANHKPATFYMPEYMIKPLTNIMSQWEKLEDHRYDLNFVAIQPGQKYKINDHYYFEPFDSKHRIPTLGYTIFERKKKLRPEYQQLSQDQLIEQKKLGNKIEHYIFDPILAYTGDTMVEVLDSVPVLKEVKYLIIEVTYGGKEKSGDRAKTWGHIHLDDLRPYLDQLKCEKLIFSHWSMGHRKHEIEGYISELPEKHQKRIVAWV